MSLGDMESIPDWPELLPEHMESAPDWTELMPELLSHIASCLPVMEDFITFRRVCASWRAASTKEGKFKMTVSKVPLLMLSQNDYDCPDRDFYSLSKRGTLRVPFSAAMGKGKRCMNAGFGWIMTLSPSGEVCLVSPFSASSIELPNIKTFPYYMHYKKNPVIHFIKGAVLTANPSETSDFALLVTMAEFFGFWRNGGQWTRMNHRHSGGVMVYCKEVGMLYTLNDATGGILAWDPHGTDLTEFQEIVKVDNAPRYHRNLQQYLVESTDGELLMITRNNASYHDIGADQFTVMRVDLVTGECEEVSDLGRDAVFLGSYTAVSVDATVVPGIIKSNCIYFTDDHLAGYFRIDGWYKGGGMDMGIYDVENQSIERLDVKSYCRDCPPIWIFPSF